MTTAVQRRKQEALLQLKEERGRAKTWELLSLMSNQIVMLEGKRGKGKTLAATAMAYQLRELFGKKVVVIGTKMGLTSEFGPFIFLDEKQFIRELDKISTISKQTPDGAVGDAVEAALKEMKVDIFDSVMVIDEAYKLFDSRTPSDKLVRVFGYFIAQSRHYRTTLLILTPNRDMLDKRVRRQIDWFGRCTTTCRSTPEPETGRLQCIRLGCLHRTTVRFVGGLDRFKLIIYGPNYWNKFDSGTIVGFRPSQLQIGRG